MGIEKLIHKIIPPCYKCPYKLGLVKFVSDPCYHCKMNGYSTYFKLIESRDMIRDTKKDD
jgi:hypothetical protein